MHQSGNFKDNSPTNQLDEIDMDVSAQAEMQWKLESMKVALSAE